MLSYRHGFHAGNAADVLKHAVLVFCLEYLTQKEKPLLCVDTHAGAGMYQLDEGFSAQKREWEKGIGRLRTFAGALPPMLQRYLQMCGAASGGSAYPGSPLIMSTLLRPVDRLVCFELHAADFALCRENLPNAEVYQNDGFGGLKGLLPPQSRRGLVLVDPPYEVKDDYRLVQETAAMALKKFSSGVYIIWYPLLRYAPFCGGDAAESFPARLMELYDGNRCRMELYTARADSPPENSPRGMYGSGLVVYNPPWTLKAALGETLPVLAAALGTGEYMEFAEGRNPAAAPVS
jgi:23S rRNA (adenine2030-N6)-methyltransferase